MVAQRTPYFIPAHGTSLAELLRSNRISASTLATACMMANQKSWEDKGWKQDEEYAQDTLGSDGETELPQYPELVSPPPKILNRFFLSTTSAVYTFSALINYYHQYLQSIDIDLRLIEAIYIVYCLQCFIESSLLSSSL